MNHAPKFRQMPVGEVQLRQPKRKLRQLLAIGLAMAAHLGLVFALALKTPEPEPIFSGVRAVNPPKIDKPDFPGPKVVRPLLRPAERRMVLRSIAARVPPPKMPRLIPVAAVILPQLENTLDLNLWRLEAPQYLASGSEVLSYPKSMAHRFSHSLRIRRLKETGSSEETEDRVIKGLRYLAESQNPDGSFGDHERVATTGLALLAFAGHGEGQEVTKAARFLLEVAENADGPIAAPDCANPARSNAIATAALAEMFILTTFQRGSRADPKLWTALNQGLASMLDLQLPDDADPSLRLWTVESLAAVRKIDWWFEGVDSALLAARKIEPNVQSEAEIKYLETLNRFEVGGPTWTAWNQQLLNKQADDGSFDFGGSITADTALGILMLETPYR